MDLDRELRGWGGWRWRHRHPCADCGHTQLHHLGFRQPGCTYLGTCRCPAFQAQMKETA